MLNIYYPLVNWRNYGKSPFLMGKSTISMAIFNSFLYVHQRVTNWGYPHDYGDPRMSVAQRPAPSLGSSASAQAPSKFHRTAPRRHQEAPPTAWDVRKKQQRDSANKISLLNPTIWGWCLQSTGEKVVYYLFYRTKLKLKQVNIVKWSR